MFRKYKEVKFAEADTLVDLSIAHLALLLR